MESDSDDPDADAAFFDDGVPLPDQPADADVKGGKGAGPNQAQLLIRMAEDQYRLIRSTDGRLYAVPRMGPNIAVPLGAKDGNGVRAKLGASLYRRTGQVAGSSALSDCLNILEGEAADLDPVPVYLRMGRHHDRTRENIVVDLGTDTGQCAVITSDGWQLEAASPVVFRRSGAMHPMCAPVAGGTLDRLRALINLSEADYRLAIGWVIAAYFTEIPHPILFVQAEQGTAKSNLIRCLLALIDPQPTADRTMPGDKREWAIFAQASWAFSFDNITEIPDWMSNALCKGVTGDAVLQRALHSDEDIVVFAFRRVIAMTTIGIKHQMAGDLVDRLLMVEPQVIERRLSEADVQTRRDAALPDALGAVFDLVANVLRVLPEVTVTNPPRMADFARILAALDQVTGWSTLPAFRTKVAELGMALIEGDGLAHALYHLARHDPSGNGAAPWEGSATALAAVLQKVAIDKNLTLAHIPTNAKVLSERVREIAPSLRKVGVDIRDRKSNGAKLWKVITRNPDTPDTASSPS